MSAPPPRWGGGRVGGRVGRQQRCVTQHVRTALPPRSRAAATRGEHGAVGDTDEGYGKHKAKLAQRAIVAAATNHLAMQEVKEQPLVNKVIHTFGCLVYSPIS